MRYNNLDLARDIGGSQNFAAAVARPVASWGRAVRSQAVPDRADQLLAQARKMEAAGRRDEALKLYRAALSAIHKAESVANKASAPGRGRTATGLVVSAQRSKPGAQTAILNYSTPAGRIGPKDAAPGQQAGGTSAAAPDAADDWLRRARELEAAGRRNEAMQAYRQASAVLRGARPASLPAPLPQ
jgi:tetratricopeptide (TPR) repeat protein